MNKQAFLSQLQAQLSTLPQAEMDEQLSFYSEMIDDRMEEGLSEAEAVLAIGSVSDIAAQIIADAFPEKDALPKAKRARRIWEIVLLILASPIYLPLLIAVLALLIALFVVLLSVSIALWAVVLSLICAAIFGTVSAIILAFRSGFVSGIALLGACAFCAGLAILLFIGTKRATKALFHFAKTIAIRIKKAHRNKKEE